MPQQVGPVSFKKVAAWASVANAEVLPNVHAYHVKRYRVKNKDGDPVLVEVFGQEPRNALMPKIRDGSAEVMITGLGVDPAKVLAAINRTWEDAQEVLEERASEGEDEDNEDNPDEVDAESD